LYTSSMNDLSHVRSETSIHGMWNFCKTLWCSLLREKRKLSTEHVCPSVSDLISASEPSDWFLWFDVWGFLEKLLDNSDFQPYWVIINSNLRNTINGKNFESKHN
jgi:hypothetical protein